MSKLIFRKEDPSLWACVTHLSALMGKRIFLLNGKAALPVSAFLSQNTQGVICSESPQGNTCSARVSAKVKSRSIKRKGCCVSTPKAVRSSFPGMNSRQPHPCQAVVENVSTPCPFAEHLDQVHCRFLSSSIVHLAD